MSRYVERAENVARFIDVNSNLALGGNESIQQQWAPLVHTTGDEELFHSRDGEFSRSNVVRFLAFDRDNRNSILSCVEQAREKARTIREVISSAMWEELNIFFHLVRAATKQTSTMDEMHSFCSQVTRSSHVLTTSRRSRTRLVTRFTRTSSGFRQSGRNGPHSGTCPRSAAARPTGKM